MTNLYGSGALNVNRFVLEIWVIPLRWRSVGVEALEKVRKAILETSRTLSTHR
jgi:hypothetical protein